MFNIRRGIPNLPYQLIDSQDDIVPFNRQNSETALSVITYSDDTIVQGYGSSLKNEGKSNLKDNSSPEGSVRFDLEENGNDVEIGDCCNDVYAQENGVLYFSGEDGKTSKAYTVSPVDLSKLDRELPNFPKEKCGRMNSPATDKQREMMRKLRKYEEESMISKRHSSTMEVIVSKMFPAGFFWQLAATLSGLSDETLRFAIFTGVCEAVGVLLCHVVFKTLRSSKEGDQVNFEEIIQTGLFLCTGTLFSATTWQPIVNTLQEMGLSFLGVFVGTWIMSTYAFNFGLRLARNIYSEKMKYVECPTWENSRIDMLLSISIGGASALFVGTDIDYRPEENFMKDLFGIHDEYSSVYGAFIAGCSTSIGFGVIQFATNLIFPAGKCWID